VVVVIEALSLSKDAGQAAYAADLLKSLEQQPVSAEFVGPARNAVAVAYALSGQPLLAADMLERMIDKQNKGGEPTLLRQDVYAIVSNSLIKAGKLDKAEEVLEWRDFLQE
jgi:hypothetical protein